MSLVRAPIGQDLQQLPDRLLSDDGFSQRNMRLDAVAIATAFFLFGDVASCDQVADDSKGGAIGDVQRGGDIARRTPGSWAMQTRAFAWLVRKLNSAIGPPI